MYFKFKKVWSSTQRPMQAAAAAAAATVTENHYRTRQVGFWKRHQILLQMCADLSNRCGAKVLVSVVIC